MIDLSKYKHISFDLDGTLVHTVPEYRHKIVPETIANCKGKECSDPRHIDCFWFESTRDKVISDEFNLDPKDFWSAFKKIDTEHSRDEYSEAYPDAIETLQKLKEMGKVTSIITGSPDWIAKIYLSKLLDAEYDFCLCLKDSTLPNKPEPDAMFETLNKLGVDLEETLYIGNSNQDAEFAKNAGCDFVHLNRDSYELKNTDRFVGVVRSLNELFRP